MITLSHNDNNSLPAILFIHGMCHGAWCWNQGFMQFFYDNGYNCFALNLPGHENPVRNPGINSYGIKDYVEAVKDAIDQIGSDTILVGHSMGGFVVQKYLEKYPCKMAVLMASVPPKGILPAALRYIEKHPEGIINLLKRDIYQPFVNHADELYSPELDTTKLEEYQKLMCADSFKALLNMMFRKVKRTNKSTPLLIIGGEADTVISGNEVQQTATFYNKQAQILEGLGHNMMLDASWIRTAEAILKWIHNNPD